MWPLALRVLPQSPKHRDYIAPGTRPSYCSLSIRGSKVSQATPGEAELCLPMFGASAAAVSCWGLEAYGGFFIHTPST